MKNIIIQLILISCIIIIAYSMKKVSNPEVSYVKSDFDGKEYLVRNLSDKDEAAYILSIIKARILILKKYLNDNIDNPQFKDFKTYIKQFNEGIDKLVLIENAPDGNYTSYTLNKGEEIGLCLRSKQTEELHDINLIMYVVIHELSHVACPEIDHTELFKKIFIFFLKACSEIGIYRYVDYSINPHEYCGLKISENLLGRK